MNKKTQHQEDIIKSVLGLLHSNQYFKALTSLEQESKIRLHSYGKEIDFLYDLLMDGRFDDAEKFIQPLRSRSEFNYTKVLYEIRKQKFLESIENSDSPNLQELVNALKEIESLASKEEFNTLCLCLSLDKITDHADYSDWTIWKGRYYCFNECIKYMNHVYPITNYQKPKINLEEVVLKSLDSEFSPKNEKIEGTSPRVQKTSTQGSRESSRYSYNMNPENKKVEQNEGSFVINESETDKESKKSVSWNIGSKEEQEIAKDPENPKSVFIESLDISSEEPQQEEKEEEEEESRGFGPTNYELMDQFDPSTLREVTKVKDIQPIRACAFNHDGDYFVLGTNSKTLKVCSLHNIVDGLIYNEQQGREQFIDIVFEMNNVHYGSVYCVDWSNSGQQIASGSNDKSIKVIYAPDFLTLQETNAETVIYSNGRYLTGEGDLPELQERLLTGHEGTVRTVLFHPVDERVLMSGGIADASLKLWNTETGQNYQSLSGHLGAIYSIAAAGDGSYVCSVGTDKKVRVWDIRSAKCGISMNGEIFSEMNSITVNNSIQNIKAETKIKIAKMYMNNRAMNKPQQNSQKLAAVGHTDGTVSIWDITAGKLFSKYTYHSSECRSVDFSSNGQWIASGSFDSTLGLIDMAKGQVFKLEPHMDRIVSAKWHPSLPILLSTSADKTARIFSIC